MVEQLRYVPESVHYARVTNILRETFPEPPYRTEEALDEQLLHALLEDQPNREKHSLGVQGLALMLAPHLKMGVDFTNDLGIAGLWHDGAYARVLQRPTGFHPIDGAVFLAHHGVPNRVVTAVLFHTAAREEARVLYKPDSEVNQLYEKIGFYQTTLFDQALEICDLQTPAAPPDGKIATVISIDQRLEEINSRYRDKPIAGVMNSQAANFRRSQDILVMVGGLPVENLLRR